MKIGINFKPYESYDNNRLAGVEYDEQINEEHDNKYNNEDEENDSKDTQNENESIDKPLSKEQSVVTDNLEIEIREQDIDENK